MKAQSMNDIAWAYRDLKSGQIIESYSDLAIATTARDHLQSLAKRLVLPDVWKIETYEFGGEPRFRVFA